MSVSIPILDPHIHLWDPRTTPRRVSPLSRTLSWSPTLLRRAAQRVFPGDALAFLGKPDYVLAPYLPGNWRHDHGAFDARSFMHVEAGWRGRGPLAEADETAWLEALCGGELVGVVGRASLTGERLIDLLDAHARTSRRFVGVRDILAQCDDRAVLDWAPAHRMRDPLFRAGYEELGRRGLPFDAWCYHPQLPDLASLVAAHPGTPVVLDHLGTPIGLGGPFGSYGRTEAARRELASWWHDQLTHLGTYPHVHAKISGLAMPVLGFGWDDTCPPSVDEVVDRLGPHVEHALRAFGPERCMFASNFPMDRVSLPWATLYEAYFQLTAHLAPEPRRALFHDNAARFYGLRTGG